jgi:CHAT domain-containing protein
LGKSTDKVYDYVKQSYENLILPIEEELKGFQSLCIVPHNVLHLLPFQALMNGNNQFMVENFSIYYAPSGSIYLKCLQSSSNTTNKFLGMALGDLEINQFAGLPGTSLEVEQISKLYPEETVKLKEETTESFLKQEASKYNIIHLATHGYFNGNDPMNSFVLFAPSKDDDGELMVREVFGLNLNAKLVTLSACETGITSITQGDEMVGLSRAFIYAGTPSIIVSLWNVSDASTALLMEKFYKNLQSHSLHEALTLAQRELIQQYRLPFYWAPFVLIGNGSTQY